MFKRQWMLLERGMVIGQCRVAGIAGLRGKTEIGQLQAPQLRDLTAEVLLRMTGMQRQQQKERQTNCGKQQKLN
jgi:hypothetical protein